MAVLPDVLVLTDRRQSEAAGRSLAETVSALVGIDGVAVVFREKDLDGEDRAALGAEVAAVGVPLIVASDPDLASSLGAVGLHLAVGDAPADFGGFVGRSCHDVDEIEDATRQAVDYATLSPVFETPSKPGYGPGLRLGGLARASGSAGMPVYALGGVTPANAAECVTAGAAGVAAMGAVMRSADPAGVVALLLAAVPR